MTGTGLDFKLSCKMYDGQRLLVGGDGCHHFKGNTASRHTTRPDVALPGANGGCLVFANHQIRNLT